MVTVGFRHSTGRTLFSRLVRLAAGRPVHCALFVSRTRSRWTCSELCAEALVAAGAPLAWSDDCRTPRRLWRAITVTG